jgi:hypothetical protein
MEESMDTFYDNVQIGNNNYQFDKSVMYFLLLCLGSNEIKRKIEFPVSWFTKRKLNKMKWHIS